MTIEIYKLAIPGEIEISFLNYGGIIQSLNVPDKNGDMSDIVLGFDDPKDYLSPHPYFGGIIGRYANRIRGPLFEIDGKTYHLTKNEGTNCLHGGHEGFDRKFWMVKQIGNQSFLLSYVSEHLDQGFPGRLEVNVTYTVNPERELIIEYQARSDQKTFINLTNHSYFNLSNDCGPIFDHELQLDSERYVAVDSLLIPTGELKECEDTLDFRNPKKLGEVIPQKIDGIDLTYVIEKNRKVAAKLGHLKTRRVLEIMTTEPGIQVYTGQLLDGSLMGKGQRPCQKYQGICLEPQHFPDSPHWPMFPPTLLSPGEFFTSKTIYRFSIY